jgi:hypothetical protein
MPLEPIPYPSLSPDAQARLERELVLGERVLWAGAGQVSRSVDAPFDAPSVVIAAVGYSVLLGGLLVRQRWEVWTLRPETIGSFAMLMMMATMAASLATLWILARLAHVLTAQRSIRHRPPTSSLYAITDRRAILWSPSYDGSSLRVASLARGQVDYVQRSERADGLWDVDLHVNIRHHLLPTSFMGIVPEPRVEYPARAVLVTTSSNPDASPMESTNP